MKILVDIGHPKDANVFKNVILLLQNKGHIVKIITKDKENIKNILDEYGFQYELVPFYKNIVSKALGIIIIDIWLYKFAKEFQPDIFISCGSPYSAQVSKLLRKPHIAYPDTEIASFAIKLMRPFTDKIYTSTSFYLNLGPKQERFDGYLELAYLCPEYFTPGQKVLDKYGINEEYIIMRLSSLSAHHDIGANGFCFKTEEDLKDYIKKLEEYCRIIIFFETEQWQTITNYKLEIDPNDLHDLLYFAKLYIGEGATMASEAAILGVPAIYVSNTRRGYLDDLEKNFDLVYSISNKEQALNKAISILKEDNLTEKWQRKRNEMLQEKINVVEFMVNSIEKDEN